MSATKQKEDKLIVELPIIFVLKLPSKKIMISGSTFGVLVSLLLNSTLENLLSKTLSIENSYWKKSDKQILSIHHFSVLN